MTGSLVTKYVFPEYKDPMIKFSLNDQCLLYLKNAGLGEEKMHPVQRIETKRTFYAAFGQALLFLRDDVSDLEEDAAVDAMQDMIEQVNDFWLGETKRQN